MILKLIDYVLKIDRNKKNVESNSENTLLFALMIEYFSDRVKGSTPNL